VDRNASTPSRPTGRVALKQGCMCGLIGGIMTEATGAKRAAGTLHRPRSTHDIVTAPALSGKRHGFCSLALNTHFSQHTTRLTQLPAPTSISPVTGAWVLEAGARAALSRGCTWTHYRSLD
jgi:hypothetical protein